MTPERFREITSAYHKLRLAVVGDYCLDRYLEIDPARTEISIETGLPVYNVVNVRAQPGGAGTILNNLASLGVGELHVVGFCGEDGEGYELRRALAAVPGANLDGLLQTPERRTFTYCKPLILEPGAEPRELSRLDAKNWTATPPAVQHALAVRVQHLARGIDGMILLEQTDVPETGVVGARVRAAIAQALRDRPKLLAVADSRAGLRDYPPVCFKMNGAELCAALGRDSPIALESIGPCALELAHRNGQPVFITVSENGIIGADPGGTVEHVPAFPVRSPIDIVGAGDAVTANLTAAMASGATLLEAMELAMAAASVVVHQLGTTGTASLSQIAERLGIAESQN